jgi:hypothetical protein
MTIAETTSQTRNSYTGNGIATVYNFTFIVLEESNQVLNRDYTIEVILSENNIDTVQQEGANYTVQLGENGLGTVTFTIAPTATQTITFLSSIPRTQSTDYINIGTDKFPADSHEGTVDKLTLVSREQDEAINRAILLPDSSNLIGVNIPVSVANADKAIVVNSAGDNLDAKNLADIGTAPVTDYAKTLLDDTTAAAARTTLGLAIGSEVQAFDADLTDIAALTCARGDILVGNSSSDWANLPIGTANKVLVSDGTNPVWSDNLATTTIGGQSLLPQQITISNGTDADHDIDFTAGNFNFDDGSGQAVATALTKQLDAAWVAGDNAGGLDTGSVATDTTYYCFAIYNPATQTSDFLFSTSSSSPTMPSGYTKKKRIASLLTDGSGNIRNGNYTFFDSGYRFIYNTILAAFTAASPVSGTDLSLDCPPNTFVLLSGSMAHTGYFSWYSVNSKIEGGEVICGVVGNVLAARSSITPPFPILADSSSDIQHGYVSGSGPSSVDLDLYGWIEYL